MLKKLTDEKLSEILETGIAEFAAHGLERANINVIAKKSGVSVGVLYKYYENKDALFRACLRRSLDVLESTIGEVLQSEGKVLARAEALIRAIQRHAITHTDYTRMYNEITSCGNAEYARMLAGEIEGISARVYGDFIARAAAEGSIRQDIDPRLFAFFFDNLLTTLQFSYSCHYYRERFRIYCGEDIESDNERVVRELLKFLESAFTFSSAEIDHQKHEEGSK